LLLCDGVYVCDDVEPCEDPDELLGVGGIDAAAGFFGAGAGRPGSLSAFNVGSLRPSARSALAALATVLLALVTVFEAPA
jgi:hypothetical protein